MKRLSTVIGSLLLFLSILGIAIGIAYIKYRQIAASMAGGPPPEMPETITVFPVTSVTFRPTTSAVGHGRSPSLGRTSQRGFRRRTELEGHLWIAGRSWDGHD